ncbi:hypothetical protein [Candidatus Vidania fulgoroideorum]
MAVPKKRKSISKRKKKFNSLKKKIVNSKIKKIKIFINFTKFLGENWI